MYESKIHASIQFFLEPLNEEQLKSELLATIPRKLCNDFIVCRVLLGTLLLFMVIE